MFLSPPGRITRDTQMTVRVHFPSLPRSRFWMSRNAPPRGRALRDIQKTATRESSTSLAKSEKKRETIRSRGTTWQLTLSRQLQKSETREI